MINKNKKINHAVILAAGRGLRMLPFTNQLPKAMASVRGSTLIEIGINNLKKKIKNIYITVGHKGSFLASHVIEQNINAVINTNNKGNSWFLFNTLLKNLNEPIFVLTCDNVFQLNLDKISDEYFKFKKPDCMIVPTKPVKGLDGDYIFQTNNIVNKLSRKRKTNIYCSGIQIMNPYKINKKYKKRNNFNKLWNDIIIKKNLYCSNYYPKFWYAVDTEKQLNELSKIYYEK